MTQTTVVKWGNPETSSFEKHSLRLATWGDTQVRVHRHVWPLVERIFGALEAAGVSVAGATQLEEPMRRGFRLPGVDQEVMDALLVGTAFAYDGNEVVWLGTPEDAAKLSDLVRQETPEDTDLVPPEPEPDVAADPEPLPEKPAPIGRDVEDEEVQRFLYHLFGNVEGIEDGVSNLQRRMGVPATGVLDSSVWGLILPRRVKWLRPGATGHEVKVMQAAFVTRGYLGEHFVVDGKWGIEFSQALRRFQSDYKIFGRMRVGTPDWEAMFGDRTPPAETPPAPAGEAFDPSVGVWEGEGGK